MLFCMKGDFQSVVVIGDGIDDKLLFIYFTIEGFFILDLDDLLL